VFAATGARRSLSMTKNELKVHIHLLSNLAFERLQEANADNPNSYKAGYQAGQLAVLEEFDKILKELTP
jgi:hypothetical protein